MVEVIWTEKAIKSIDEIANYISKDSLRYAKELVSKFYSKVEYLQLFPESGRVVPEFKRKDLRELIVGQYRIVYQYIKHESKINIVVIYHSKRMLKKDIFD